MDRDTLIFIAFCAFVLLLGLRAGLQFRDRTEKSETERTAAGKTVQRPEKSRRRFFSLVQVIVLGGLLIYMVPLLIRDFNGTGPTPDGGFVLRCLIFVFTIYIFISRGRRLFRQRVKGNRKK